MKLPTYDIQLRKIVSSGHRNINSYYITLKNSQSQLKYFTKAMRLDEDNQDTIIAQVQIKPNKIQIWNYDKMLLVQRIQWDFKIKPIFNCSIYQDNMQLTIKRNNPYQIGDKSQAKSSGIIDHNQQTVSRKSPKTAQKKYQSKQISAKSIQISNDKNSKASNKIIKSQSKVEKSITSKASILKQSQKKEADYNIQKHQSQISVDNKAYQLISSTVKSQKNNNQGVDANQMHESLTK